MSDIAPLFQIVIGIAAIVVPAIVLGRWLGGGDHGTLATLFVATDYSAWPRGVQEEEPKAWAFGRMAPDPA